MGEVEQIGQTWDVVATVRADPVYVERFVDAYRRLGAKHIHIFFDDPAVVHRMAGDDLTLTVCDEEHWKGARPDALERRQTRNGALAAARSGAEWILHCDIDEIVAPEDSVAGFLGDLPPEVGCVRVLPAEAVFAQRPVTVDDIFATPWFKSVNGTGKELKRFWNRTLRDVPGLAVGGFIGHRLGKCFVRVAEAGTLRQFPLHRPMKVDLERLNTIVAEGLVLRHYDALLPDAWASKHIDRATGRVLTPKMGDRRIKLMELVAERHRDAGVEGVLELYDRLFVMSERRLHRALTISAVRRIDPASTGLAPPGS